MWGFTSKIPLTKNTVVQKELVRILAGLSNAEHTAHIFKKHNLLSFQSFTIYI